jgi:hypothetical protein
LRNALIIISTLLVLAFLSGCTSSNDAAGDVEKKALYLANTIDSGSLNLLRKFSYGARGDDNFWLRVSGNSNLYVCNYKREADTAKVTIWRPDRFIYDFPTDFRLDTSIYSEFTFSQVRDKIVKIELDSSRGKALIKDTLVKTEELFRNNNPFTTFSYLTSIAKKYNFTGSSYSSEIGDFFIFRISPDFKLFYIPDTLGMNPEFKNYWLDKFKKGKKIKQDWSLVEVNKK